MKKILIIIFLTTNFLIAQNVGTNFRVFPGTITQTEPVITVSPINNNILFASAVTINTNTGFRSEGVYVSTDAGLTWTGTDTCKGENIINHGGDPGVIIDNTGRLIIKHIGSISSGVYTHYSNDFGDSWSNANTVSNSGQPVEDKSSITMDNSPISSYYNRIYITWVENITPYPVLFSYVDDIINSWSQPKIINPNPPQRCSGGTVAVDNSGNVYASWAGMTGSFPPKEDYAGFAKSTDGGVTWNVQQNIFDMNGIAGTLQSKNNIKVNGLPRIAVDKSGGERDGWIYLVTTEKDLAPAGSDPDIIFHRSTDGGNSWSAASRINQDALNNGKIQYFPAIAVDDEGNINILYYDDRNTSSDSTEVFLSRSTDGGDTWTEIVVSDHRFKPKPIIGGSSNYQGDHIDLLAVENKLYAVWMDDYSGIYQVWASIIEFDPDYLEDEVHKPAEFKLYQNYPNPFNPVTSISFRLREKSPVTLKVYDVLGKEVVTLISEIKPEGSYTVKWDAMDNPSGVYFYKLQAGKFVDTKKMILLR